MKKIILFLAVTAIAFLSYGNPVDHALEKPNIIIFYADDMGYGDLGCFGNPNIRTSNIDRLAEEGLKLTSFYVAAPSCTPSRAALLSGRYPIYTLPRNLGPTSKNGFPANEPIISELLKNAGYKTMAVGKWHLGHATENMLPTGRGFDHFYGLLYSNDMIKPWVNTDVPLYLYVDETPSKVINYDQDSLTINYTMKALKFIKNQHNKPFFLYLPYSMPHLPINTIDKFKGKSEGGLYGDVIETIDWSVGEIFKTLQALDIEENTLIIFASDNGPWHNLPGRMLQKGVKPWHQGTAGLLNGSKGTTYEGGMRVPGIIYWKNHIKGGQISSDIVTTMDIYPTIASIVGEEIPDNKELDGYDLLPFLLGKSSSPRKEFFYFRGEKLEAVRKKNWKLRFSGYNFSDGTMDNSSLELFDLANDPAEKYNMAEIHPDTVNYLLKLIKEKANKVNADLNKY